MLRSQWNLPILNAKHRLNRRCIYRPIFVWKSIELYIYIHMYLYFMFQRWIGQALRLKVCSRRVLLSIVRPNTTICKWRLNFAPEDLHCVTTICTWLLTLHPLAQVCTALTADPWSFTILWLSENLMKWFLQMTSRFRSKMDWKDVATYSLE